MKRKILILALLVIGIGLIAFPYSVRYYHEIKNKSSYDQLVEASKGLTEKEAEALQTKITECNNKLKTNQGELMDPFSSNKENLDQMKTCLGMNQEDVFAILEIPVLNLVVPIYLSATEEFLSKGIGLVEGSSLPIGGDSTHTVLAGHRGLWTQQMLMYADKIQEGHYFYIHTMIETLEYRVYSTEVVYPDETNSLEVEEGKDLATLITCHPFPTDEQRLLIHGERVQ